MLVQLQKKNMVLEDEQGLNLDMLPHFSTEAELLRLESTPYERRIPSSLSIQNFPTYTLSKLLFLQQGLT